MLVTLSGFFGVGGVGGWRYIPGAYLTASAVARWTDLGVGNMDVLRFKLCGREQESSAIEGCAFDACYPMSENLDMG